MFVTPYQEAGTATVKNPKHTALAATHTQRGTRMNIADSVNARLAGISTEEDRLKFISEFSAANPAAMLELIRQRDELLASLKEARELVEDWGAYAGKA